MNTTTLRIAAAIVAVLLPLSIAQAKYSPVTQFCGGRVCSKTTWSNHRFDYDGPSVRHHRHIAHHKTKAHPVTKVPASVVDANANPVEHKVGWPQTLHKPVAESSLTTIDGCFGLHVRVASEYASKFQGFFCALKAAGYKVPSGSTACQAFGHMTGSKHDWGGACDVGQRARNIAVGFMYHITAIAHRFGLTDGCSWGNRDCGHVEVAGSNAGARSKHYALYGGGHNTVMASARRHYRRRHYASRRHHYTHHHVYERRRYAYLHHG